MKTTNKFNERERKLTKKQIKEAQEREHFLRMNRNGVFGSIY